MNVYQQEHSQVGSKTMYLNVKRSNGDKEKGSLKSWGCGEPHLLRNYPHNLGFVQNIQDVYEATTVNELARNISRISVALEDRQVKH